MRRRMLSLVLLCSFANAEPAQVLSTRTVHLRSGDVPEWEEFANKAPEGRQLDLRFQAAANPSQATLFIRQNDVRHGWRVELNGRRLGNLFEMEADLVHTLSIPAGVLRDGENHLGILPPQQNDDIFIHQIALASEFPAAATAEATLELFVTDASDGSPLPSRITVTDGNGSLAAVVSVPGASSDDPPLLAIRPGVIYTGDGRARIGVGAGDYTIYASRGFEYSVATQQVQVAKGQVETLEFAIEREVPTPGLISCDTHTHTFTFSRHGDAGIEERVLTIAGEGIELPVAADHNIHVDYSEAAEKMRVAQYFTPVIGNEVTTPAGHFNIFPVEPDARVPDFKITDWPRLMTAMRATPGVRVVVLNHPRSVHSNFRPFAPVNFNPVTGENRRGFEFTFDAMEVLNSSAQQSDYMLLYHDWFALLNYGHRITTVGSSDAHDVSRYILGQGRTYIMSDDTDPARLDVEKACSNLLAGRAFVSMGLLPIMTVDDRFQVGDLATDLGKTVRVQVKVLGPSWVTAGRIKLFANGIKVREKELDPEQPGGVKATVTWTLPRPAHDVHLVAIATGPAVTAPFWAIPRPYQPSSPVWVPRVIGSTNPIWLDADGDGQFTAARSYARHLVEKHGTVPTKLLPALADFDEAVAAQAASLCAASGLDLASPEFTTALESAPEPVQRGFAAYKATQL